jgi:phospholipase C
VKFNYEIEKVNSKKNRTEIIGLYFSNKSKDSLVIEITDNVYKSAKRIKSIAKSSESTIPIDTSKSFGWYDFTIRIKGNSIFEKRYAGHIETGRPSKTDPFMGRVI